MDIIFHINKALSIAFIVSVNCFIYYNLPFNFNDKLKKQLLVCLPLFIISFLGLHLLIFQDKFDTFVLSVAMIHSFTFIIAYYFYTFFGNIVTNLFVGRFILMTVELIKKFFIPIVFIMINIFQITIILGLLKE